MSTTNEPRAAHTPGPWIVDATPAHCPCVFMIRAKAEKCDAWVPLATVHNSMNVVENAALISSAPALLAERDKLRAEVERLRAALASTQRWVSMYEGKEGHDAAARAMGEVIRAALSQEGAP